MAKSVLRAWTARGAACCLAVAAGLAHAQDPDELLPEPPLAEAPALAAPLAPEFEAPSDEQRRAPARVTDPDAAEFDAWEPLVQRPEPLAGEPLAEPFSSFDEYQAELEEAPAEHELRPFDWLRHWGFHHSSTEGPFLDKNVPMQYTSWLNRPYHIDAWAGPLLVDSPVDGRVTLENTVIGGLRVGWDFDYYWGIEWRMGWADPNMIASEIDEELSSTFMISDVNVVYYPWGDTKVRPFVQWGLGFTEVGSVRPDGTGIEVTMLSMPFGAGLQFPLTRWMALRMEVLDNLAFGADGVDTMNNFTFTAGIDMRFGARPSSYWPWRSSRTIW